MASDSETSGEASGRRTDGERLAIVTEAFAPSRFPGENRAEKIGELRKPLKLLVGAEGFEPPTPCSRSKCATRLRYAPPMAKSRVRHGRMPAGKAYGHGIRHVADDVM